MIWEIFRKEKPGGYHIHCGNVHAPNRELAQLFAQIQHGRRKPVDNLWVVPQEEITAIDADEGTFGGTTDKSYRWAMTYTQIDAHFAEEVAASEQEQEEADRQRARQR